MSSSSQILARQFARWRIVSSSPSSLQMAIYQSFSSASASEATFKVAHIDLHRGTMTLANYQTPELLKVAGIYARDLFTLNLTSRQERQKNSVHMKVRRTLAAILPRKNLIVVSFGNIRAVVNKNAIFILDSHMPAAQDFARNLAEIYKRDDLVEERELVFMEEVLRDTIDAYGRRLRLFEPIVDSFLDKVANEVYSDTGVHQLVPLKDSLQAFEIQVKQSLDCLTRLLQNDDEMLALLLNEQAEAEARGETIQFARHEHVELLLGVYARQLNNIALEISYLLGRLQSKQEFVALALAGYRNRMIRMNVHIGIAGLSLGLGTTMAGFFGMNLINGYEENAIAFTSVVAGAGLGGMIIALSSLSYLSGKTMQARANQRLQEIETLTGALSDMCALDYTMKRTVQKIEQGQVIDKEKFRAMLKKARQSKSAPRAEVDLLFDVFDRVRDGELTDADFEMEEKEYWLEDFKSRHT